MIKPLAKSVLIPLGLTAAASAADGGIHKKIVGSGNTTTLIISNDEINGIIKIVKSLEYSGLLLKEFTETVQSEVKEQKGGFLSMLLGTLGASLLGNILTGRRVKTTSQERGINRAGKCQGINRAGEGALVMRQGRGIVRTGYGSCSSKMDF